MTSHDSFTSVSSRVATVKSLLLLKMEAFIPAPADCDVRSVIKFLNAQSIVTIEIHRQLCQVYGLTRLVGQHISCRCSAGRYLFVIHLIARISRPVISIFPYISRYSCLVSVSVFRMTERHRWVSHSGSNPRRHTSTTQDTKVGPTVRQMSQFLKWMCWNITQRLLYLFQLIFLLNGFFFL